VIKRYGNRRLYDAAASRSVTVSDIADLIRKGEDVRIVDGDTGEDLTRRVYTQIILEEGNARQLELLPVELLRKLITLRSDPMARWLEQYLAAGAQFLERQVSATGPAAKVVREQMDALFPWLKAEPWAPVEPPPPPPREEPAESVRDEIAELQRKLADLSAKVKRR
jgi:polyhydroxyalkanoate synthesis repressor PhaR